MTTCVKWEVCSRHHDPSCDMMQPTLRVKLIIE